MIIRSAVTLEMCKRIADRMDCELYNSGTYDMETVISRPYRIKLQFTLRPKSGSDTYRSYDPISGRRIWAVDWQGHYVFMRAVLEIDPSARITTSRANYQGRDDFLDRAINTSFDNVGSQMYPVYAGEKSLHNSGMSSATLDAAAIALI